VPTDGAEGIQHLSAQIEARTATAFEGSRVNFGEGNAAAGNLGLSVSLVPGPRQLVPDQQIH
jgi:hypothetical protein